MPSPSAQSVVDNTTTAAAQAIDNLREAAPAAIGRAAAQVQDFTRRGIDRVVDFGTDVRDKAQRAGDRTVGYIQDEPVKAVLIAAAAGAAVALLLRALSGRNPH